MQVAAILSPPSQDDLRQACGGELGATLFVAGLRIWVPEAARRIDIEHAAEALRRLGEVGGYE